MTKKKEKYFCRDCGKEIMFCDTFNCTRKGYCYKCAEKRKEAKN